MATAQDYLLTAIDSTVEVDGFIVKDVEITTNAVVAIQSKVTLGDMVFMRITATNGNLLLSITNSDITVTSLSYSDSSVQLMLSSYSSLALQGLRVTNVTVPSRLLTMRENTVSGLSDWVVSNVKTNSGIAFESISTNITNMSDMKIETVTGRAFYLGKF